MTSTLRSFTQSYFEKHQQRLKSDYPGVSLRILLHHLETYCARKQLWREIRFDQPFNPGPRSAVTQFFQKLDKGVPFEYITGYAYFYRSEFMVTPQVLIPRNETEGLVELAVNFLNKERPSAHRVIDVGVGSGAVILSLMREITRPIEAIGIDISEAALKVATRNKFSLRFTFPKMSTLELLHGDRLHGIQGGADLIVSNPPYIPLSRRGGDVHDQVEKYEPHEALFLPDETYQKWYEVFFQQVKQTLNREGCFLLEGHEDHLKELSALAEQSGLGDVEVLPDLTGRARFLRAYQRS